MLGAYVGAALGTLLGMALAPSPGPDDTAEFEGAVAAIGGILLLTPIGAMIGYHAGKRELPRDGATSVAAAPFDDGQVRAPPAVEPRRGTLTEPTARRLLLSIVNVSW